MFVHRLRSNPLAGRQAAADQPYFYEALIIFSRQRIPYGRAYAKWRTTRRKQIEAGKEIYYLGKRDTNSG